MLGSGNDWLNKNVFSCCRKEETDGADCASSGRVFHKMETVTENERRPAVDMVPRDVQLQRRILSRDRRGQR